jgi:iron(III) transport system ATP-binding protein
MSAVELVGIAKSYGRTTVLTDVTLSIAAAGITAVLGPSGSGKTTLLRLIAGFERADAGTISIAGRVVDDRGTHVRPERRGIGYVPQDGALFPHLNAARNISFGLGRGDRGRVGELLELVGLSGLRERYPHELSGGQQQRVALARALAIRPALILLDEPFSSLDASLRVSLRRDIAAVLAETSTPAVIVTHDQDEALSLAHQVVIIDHGSILSVGSPSGLYQMPDSTMAASYLGEANLLQATVVGSSAHCSLGDVAVGNPLMVQDGPATVLIRPEQVRFVDGGVPATIAALDYYGHDSLATLVLADQSEVTARITGVSDHRPGDQVGISTTGTVVAFAQ